MYDYKNSCGQVYWCIEEITPHIEIYSTLHRKSMILSRVVFSDCDELKKICQTLRFIAHYIRNQRLQAEFCATILINWKNYATDGDS